MISNEDPMIIPCKAKIELFPSRNEVLQLLDEIISNNKYKKEYYCDNRDNIIIITFKDSNIAFEFLKVINIQKVKNPLYAKTKTALIFDSKSSKGNSNQSSQNHIVTVTKGKTKTMHLYTEPNVSLKRIKTNKKKIGYKLTNRSPVLISDPYLEPKTLMFADYSKNKSRWINPNGFKRYVNPERSEILGEIGTYVTRSQADYTYKNFKHRDVNKKKWITEKNFEIKHLPDYI